MRNIEISNNLLLVSIIEDTIPPHSIPKDDNPKYEIKYFVSGKKCLLTGDHWPRHRSLTDSDTTKVLE